MTPAIRTPLAATLAIALAALAGCKQDTPATPAADGPSDRAWTDAQRVEAIASTLQACSYDGQTLQVQPGQLRGPAPGDCEAMVQRIMGFTGLPANFVVTAGPVDNAAAVILLDKAQVPQRVIAFNPDFIAASTRATGGDTWAPVSIMAHEIGHHLSGHTITGGGSRPAIELEADRFSGYVLHKMGAALADATKAILTFGTDADQPTHPSKSRRAAAIAQGWQESCRQSGAADCAAGNAPPVATAPVALPAPAPDSIPFKYGRFVVDETGKLDPALVAEKSRALYALAKDRGAEIVYLVVNDLHGMQADAYALAMMRQLRVGKLDIGNGAVLVVAPRQRQVGVALGPGIAHEAQFTDVHKTLSDWTAAAWRDCDDADGCGRWTANLLDGLLFMRKWIENAEWQVAYQGMDQALRADGPTGSLGKLVRFEATVETLSPPDGIGKVNRKLLDSSKVRYQPVGLKTDDGLEVIAYVDPATTTLMPSGALKQGARYTMVGRMQSAGDRKAQASGVWLFSYEPL